tara:strand:- start:12298 stop:13374 length:1077 start_codon:yes stop_codon:yes gene_type:complete
MIFKSNFKKKKIIKISAFLLVLIGGLILKVGTKQNAKSNLNEFITYAESGYLPGLVTSSGELQSEKSVNISPKRQGLVEDIYVKEGEKVIKGQLLAKMNGGDLIFRINELKSEYETQKSYLQRREFLYSEGAISKESYEEYKNLLLKSEARLKQRQVEENELHIRAPFQGIITSSFAFPGSFVTPTTSSTASTGGSTSTSIVELSQGLEVLAKVPESDIGRIAIGQQANIKVDAFPDQIFLAKVTEISPRAIKSNNVTSFEVTLLLIKRPQKLRIGMTADVEFQTGKTSISTLVPTVAIVTKNGVPGLLLVGPNNQPRFNKVELGISSGSKTAIIKGVMPGDQIFIDLPPWAKKSKGE